jgi:hypothetical protein
MACLMYYIGDTAASNAASSSLFHVWDIARTSGTTGLLFDFQRHSYGMPAVQALFLLRFRLGSVLLLCSVAYRKNSFYVSVREN